MGLPFLVAKIFCGGAGVTVVVQLPIAEPPAVTVTLPRAAATRAGAAEGGQDGAPRR
ncbi:hypothetical protein GCM10010377_41620 [Streptomyces viridiviolaceus]|uniref:Histidine kinase n=1 Tax=Streptomyces viridiviolaceus TaxID=68282 RepID=A0ABW2EA98_9ACTN|nr:hypothetical protein [Streptomyces viridiviolaceus]GHB46418.1 hypothetical protein GCM10010377_41620 [Streptomyces viridiviolaceus]